MMEIFSSFLFLSTIIFCYAQQIKNIYFSDYYSSTSLDYLALINSAWTADKRGDLKLAL
ncbi:hypothetical protein MYP_412 [Sporocytophaga myxococcoides]|uniref:Uncharacterized protein n=1 Tax=Sporocytophaga myxococcoides TaxID=153721 RepID=A0A098L8N2_9BACT|nr:hypothetical protein MYP_412 [Sporocytophaga myxococcoides]